MNIMSAQQYLFPPSYFSNSAVHIFQMICSTILFMEPCTFFKMRKLIQILYCKEVVPDLKKT